MSSYSSIVESAALGCHIAIIPTFENPLPPFALSISTIAEAFGEDASNLPDFAIDPETKTLSVINTCTEPRVAIVSVQDARCLGRDGESLAPGWSSVPDGVSDDQTVDLKCKVTTFIVLSPGLSVLETCTIKAKRLSQVRIDSHLGDPWLSPGPVAGDEDYFSLPIFPLLTTESTRQGFMCTQSSFGAFTHFQHPSTRHAVDFQAPEGTPVVAVMDGTVVGTKVGCKKGGCHVSNLFDWNGITIECSTPLMRKGESPFVIEYVHLSEIFVQPGEHVSKGQVIGLSGSSGFCPEPHLHFEVHRKGREMAESIPVIWKGKKFEAGAAYGQSTD